MRANLVVAEMDPSRVDVACRAVTHELLPFFQAQRGAGSGYWMVDRATGEVLVLTTWDDEDALTAVRATDCSHRARAAGRTGLVVRSITSLDVVESDDAGLTPTPVSRWARATWTGVAAGDRRAAVAADERQGPAPCGTCRLHDAATGACVALRLWDQPSPAKPGCGGLQGLGVTARSR